MSSALTKFRVLVLVAVFSLTVVPTAATAAMPDDNDPKFTPESIVQVVKTFLKKLGLTPNESIAVPKP